jgi:hypothetical protein
MGRKKRKPEDQPPKEGGVKHVKVRADVHRAARIIGLHEGILLEDLVDSILRPAIQARYRAVFGNEMPEV